MMCQENDIILCDGNCCRAYHEKCLEPPQDITSLPEDEGWLCPACDAKASPSGPDHRLRHICLCSHMLCASYCRHAYQHARPC